MIVKDVLVSSQNNYLAFIFNLWLLWPRW